MKNQKSMEITTLNEIEINEKWTDEEMDRRNRLLLLVSQLSTLQMNIAKEIEQLYQQKGAYNFLIKHNHRKIISLLDENTASIFFKRINDGQALVYADNAEQLEKLVFVWAGLQKADKSMKINGTDLNKAAKEAYDCARKRGKISRRTSDLVQINAIKDETRELLRASLNNSIHIPYTEQQEEAADVIIATLTLLHGKGIDINALVRDKMEYNEKRND